MVPSTKTSGIFLSRPHVFSEGQEPQEQPSSLFGGETPSQGGQTALQAILEEGGGLKKCGGGDKVLADLSCRKPRKMRHALTSTAQTHTI
jgi:hypothetical protein